MLVRYNPINRDLNKEQLIMLMQLSAFCEHHNFPLLFELLVPPTKAQESKTFDTKLRPKLACEAIKEIQRFVKVSIWKIEGMSKQQWKEVIATTESENPKPVFIVLGRNAPEKTVDAWLKAAKLPRVAGFAVGRTIFFKPLEAYLAGKMTREQTVKSIAKSFRHFVDTWNR